jgi:ubiquinone/menaquinone biosynthesis C-methylase UbiE
MVETDKLFAGAIPDIYDTYLVPLIFESYASDLAARVAARDPSTVLETASGSGVVTRALAPLLRSDARYLVTDLNQPMIDRAAREQGRDDRISWQQADALELPFEDKSFDAVCCQFGVMFFPDRVAGFREARRVLKPGGVFLFNTWDRIEENIFAKIVTDTAAHVFPQDPPLFLARTPHGYHDKAVIRSEVEQAGYAQIEIETVADVSSAPSPRHPAVAYCQGTPLRSEIEARDPGSLDRVTDLAEAAIAQKYGRERVSAKIQGHIVTAIAPA